MQGIKRKAVLSKTMERTAENRMIFGVGIKKKKSRNPHGYWIFRWQITLTLIEFQVGVQLRFRGGAISVQRGCIFDVRGVQFDAQHKRAPN